MLTSPYGCGGWTRTSNARVKVWCVTITPHRNIVERVKGFEPSLSAWRAYVLTVEHYTRIFCNRAKGLSPLGAMAGFVFATTSSGLSSPCDQHSNHFTLLLHISVFLRDVLCGRSLPDSNREPARYPRAMLTNYTRLLISAATNSLLYGQYRIGSYSSSTLQYGSILTTRLL